MPFDEDHSAFFQEAEFGIEAQHLPANGPGRVLNGILEWCYVEVGGKANSTRPVFTCSQKDLDDVNRGDDLVVKAQRFVIKDFEPDGQGMTRIMLSSNDRSVQD